MKRFVPLRQIDSRGRRLEFTVEETTLIRDIVHDDSLSPQTEIRLDDRWVPLGRVPNPPWRDEMARQLVAAVEQSSPQKIDKYADKIFRFGVKDNCEVVRLAQFVRGHMSLCAGKYHDAVMYLEPAAHTRSSFSPAAHLNLGTAWALLRNPMAALEQYQLALAEDPAFVPAAISLRNLARILVQEHAPEVPGQAPWADLARQASERLRQTPASQVRALLQSRRRFPAYPCWHLLEPGPYFPALSSQMSAKPHGRRAAARLLTKAHQAQRDGDWERARLLATSAGRYDPALKPAADALAATSAGMLEEARLLAEAERLVAWLDDFLRDLNDLSLESLDAARESLVLLSSVLKNQDFEPIYRRRIEQIVSDALARAGKDDRSRLLVIAHQYAVSASAAAYERAADYCLAHKAVTMFWQAVNRNDLSTARAALERAGKILGPDDAPLKDARDVLVRLEQRQALEEPGR